MHRDAVSCPDNWHCCPRGSHCSPNCNFRTCKCLFPSSHPVAATKSNKEAEESKSHSGSHSASVKSVKESKEKEVVSKTQKEQKKKHKTSKDTNRTKLGKKANGKLKHKLSLKDNKNKKHKPSREKKERKKTKKLRSKAKDYGSKLNKLKKLKKTKSIQKMGKNVVKAHKTHQKTNFHPTSKPHWVATLDNRLGALKKHKPNIKFSHTWGKRKHQKLSYKSNREKNNRLEKGASMADELKHLIVNHRKEKLRRRFKLRVGGHVKQLHGSHRKSHTGLRKQTTRKKQKEEVIHPHHTRNILKKQNSKSNFRNKYVKEHKSHNKMKKNLSGHTEKLRGQADRVTVNVFDNLRQTLHHKVLAKENVSLKLGSSKLKGVTVGHLANTTADNKTEELGKNKNESIVESGETTDFAKGLQRTSSTEKMPLKIDKNDTQEMTLNLKKVSDTSSNASTNTEDSENSTSINSTSVGIASIQKEGELSNTAAASVSNDVTKGETIENDEEKSRTSSFVIIKPNYSGIDERTAGQNQNSLEAHGNVKNGTSQNNNAVATITAKNASNADADDVVLVTGMRSQARMDQVSSGSGLGMKADEFFIGPASGFKTSTTLSGDNDDSFIDEHIKVFLGGEDTASSTKDLENYEISKEIPSGDSLSESFTNESDGLYKISPLTNVYMESGNAETASGSSFETFSAEAGSDLHFGGEGDNDDDRDVDERNSYSSGRDDVRQSELFPSSGTASFNHMQKLEKADNEQSFDLQNEDSSSGSSTDLSQMRYNDWDDAAEKYSGFGSDHYESSKDEWGSGEDGSSSVSFPSQAKPTGLSQMRYNGWDDAGETYSGFRSDHYESSTDEWGSGEDESSSASFSSQAKPIPFRKYTTAKNSNNASSVYQNSGNLDEEVNKDGVASGEDMNLEKRNHIFGPPIEDQKRSRDKTELRVKSLRGKHTKKGMDAKNSDDFSSWEDKELDQLLYWLSIATEDDNNLFKQIMTHKDMQRLRPKPTSGYSRLQDRLLQKIFPDFSKNKREEFKEKNDKEKEIFLMDASPVLTTSGSGIETSNRRVELFRTGMFR